MIYKTLSWIIVLAGFCLMILILSCGCIDNQTDKGKIEVKRYYKLNVEGHGYICIRTVSTSYSEIFGSIVHDPDCELCKNRKGD